MDKIMRDTKDAINDYNAYVTLLGKDSITARRAYEDIILICHLAYATDIRNIGFECECVDIEGYIDPDMFEKWIIENSPVFRDRR